VGGECLVAMASYSEAFLCCDVGFLEGGVARLDGFDGGVAGQIVDCLGGVEDSRLEVVHEGAETGGEVVAAVF